MRSPRYRYAAAALGGGLVVLALQGASRLLAVCNEQYDLLSPARRCIDVPSQGGWNYEPLREALIAKKEEMKASGALTHLSIYFQDLEYGPRFAIGEYDKFHPASLMKLPVFIFFLHAADLDPMILDKQLSFSGSLNVEDSVTSPEETLQPNTPYAIRDMLRKMIVYSDNRSYLMLLREMSVLSEEKAYDTFHDLDVLQMMLSSEETYVSISSYAKLYAVLYNTGYLSKEMSQLALQLLSEATFRQGIVAGVPSDLRVAHKFGYTAVDGESQLHDCGIVYHPKMAYTLCVMTSGTDQNAQNAAIIEISRMVYSAISAEDLP